MNATTPPTHNLPPAVKRPNGSQPGTARRLVLAELQHHARNMRFTPHTTPPGISPQQLASATGLHIDKVRQAISAMQAAGQVVNAGPTHRRPLWRLYTPPTATATATAQPSMTAERHLHGKGDYIPTELRAFTDRPRAMDAFTLPSLVNGQRVPAKRPSAQLVGALADRTNNARG